LPRSKQTAGQNVWLNHYPGQTRALPSAVDFEYNDPPMQGRVMKTIVMTSGMGGKLFATFESASGSFLEGLPSVMTRCGSRQTGRLTR
jgi:hypothetical protein